MFWKLPNTSRLRSGTRVPTGRAGKLKRKSMNSLPASAKRTRLLLLSMKNFKLTLEGAIAVCVFTDYENLMWLC